MQTKELDLLKEHNAAVTFTLLPPVASLEATDKKVLQHSWPL